MKIRSTLKSALTFNFLLVAVLPILVIGFVTLQVLTKQMTQEIANKNFVLAKSLAGEVERFFNEPMHLLERIKEVAEGKSVIQREQINKFLEA
ncbi:MAG: hypothetical protein U9R17_12670, partial [Thermodesulfobacteriota bacterium]|nr:hypothetical protein [Thermodesulfobacteriota bacterium]